MDTLKKILVMALVLFSLSLVSCAQPEATSKSTPNTTSKDSVWKNKLTKEQYYILREKGTERPFSGKFLFHKKEGNYTCAACDAVLFNSDSKFDSHCGWPSFDSQVDAKSVRQTVDSSHGMIRTEITCGNCGGHLGHVFNDGPTKTGLRYCVNSLSLGFSPLEDTSKTTPSTTDTITLGGGCFWCVEAIFQEIKGVSSVTSGYAGGNSNQTNYKKVSSGATGHAEVIQIIFDTTQVSLAQILQVFFKVHDPTTLNRQGADVGTQYRSAIFYRNTEQQNLASKIIRSLNQEKAYDRPIVTEVNKLKVFIPAENYHQNYFNNNKNSSYCKYVIQPKMDKFEKAFANLLKK